MESEKKCENCGASFSRPVYKNGKKCSLTNWKKQRYCSSLCSNHWHTKARRLREKEMPAKICKHCKVEFRFKKPTRLADWKRQQFCSRICASKHPTMEYKTGADHPRWKGGRSSLNEKIRKTPQYAEWRSAIFHRDRYTCQECGACGTYLNADHIEALAILIERHNLKTLRDARHCIALWQISNGRTLCLPCHTITETYGGRVVGTMHRSTQKLST